MGTNLPPQPYEPENDATVAGLDKNNNGIRDDVELAIFAKYPKSAKIRAAELQYPTNTAATGSDITGTAPDGAGRPAGGKPPAPGVSTGGKGDETHDDDAAPSD